jgi:predicted O-methyltransferase YrrM
MPRNGSGTMSIVNTASPNTVITSSDYNENFADVADEITNSLALDGRSIMQLGERPCSRSLTTIRNNEPFPERHDRWPTTIPPPA